MRDEQTARTARKARIEGAARRLGVATLLALAALALAAAGAQAVVVTVSGERISLEPLPQAAQRVSALAVRAGRSHTPKNRS